LLKLFCCCFNSFFVAVQIKPANILLRARATHAKATATSNGASAGTSNMGPSQTPASPSQRLHLRVCDLGSAVDSDEALNALLYPPPRFAPSRLDNTLQYAPPEVLFGGGGGSGDDDGGAAAGPAYSSTHPHSYDMWSAGVVALELLLGGGANVFRIDERVRARVEARVEEALAAEFRRRQQSDPGADSEAERAKWTATVAERKEKAALFRALIEYGVYPTSAGTAGAEAAPATDGQQPSSSPHGDNGASSSDIDSSHADSSCSDEHFSDLLRQFDPTGIGAPDKWLVKLIRVRGAERRGRGGGKEGRAAAASRSRTHCPAPQPARCPCAVGQRRLLITFGRERSRADAALTDFISALCAALFCFSQRLLRWHPAARLSAAAALSHAYFRGAFACGRCGAQFEFESQLQRHHFEQHGATQQHAAG
jgi:serine/threonine protein kinase